MRWGVVIVPRLERRSRRAARRSSACSATTRVPLWHKDDDLHGRRLRRAAGRLLLRRLPALRRDGALLADHGGGRRASRDAGGLVLGICNGFQILCEAGLLPGRAGAQPRRCSFVCDVVHVRVEDDRHAVHQRLPPRRACSTLPIKHGEGCYVADEATLAALEDERPGRAALRRRARARRRRRRTRTARSRNIAGVVQRARATSFGLMPHPEHAVERLLGGEDGLKIFRSVQAWLGGVRRGGRARADGGARALMSMHDPPSRPTAPPSTGSPRRSTRASCDAARPRADLRGARRLRGHVVGALLATRARARYLQQLPTHGPARAAGARARTPASSTSATGSPWSSRSRATTIRRSSSRSRARRPASAASCATSSPWARGRSPSSTRCASAARPSAHAATCVRGVVAGIGGYGNCIGVPTVGGEVVLRPGLRRQHPGERLHPRRRRRPTASSARSAAGVGNPVIYVGSQDRARRHPRREPARVGRVRRRGARASGRPCRSAIRSPRSCCSRPASS